MGQTPLFDSLKEYSGLNRGYFRIPGHRFGRGINPAFTDFAGKSVFRLDVTETPMSDDLHNPSGVIAQSQNLSARAFGADGSFYLINGTTCGNQSMIIASAGEGQKILVPRNAHKSVLSGLIMSGAVPVFLMPEPVFYPGTGKTFSGSQGPSVPGPMSPAAVRRALAGHDDLKAVFAVSPTYHGFCGDLAGIASLAEGADIPLLVDEAHGAHLYFNGDKSFGALRNGAHACVQSIHKTAGALTQSSILHYRKGLVDPEKLDSALRMTMSTSPSYVLMTSIELAVEQLEREGEMLWERTMEFSRFLEKSIGKIRGYSLPEPEALKSAGVFLRDSSRLWIGCAGTGLTGYEIKRRLWDDFRIDIELADSQGILVLLSPGNTREEAENIVQALTHIAASAGEPAEKDRRDLNSFEKLPPLPEAVLTPRQAYFTPAVSVPWNRMEGRIAAQAAAVYPPGIPVVYPGEIITREIKEYLDTAAKKGLHFHGIKDQSLLSFMVCDV